MEFMIDFTDETVNLQQTVVQEKLSSEDVKHSRANDVTQIKFHKLHETIAPLPKLPSELIHPAPGGGIKPFDHDILVDFGVDNSTLCDSSTTGKKTTHAVKPYGLWLHLTDDHKFKLCNNYFLARETTHKSRVFSRNHVATFLTSNNLRAESHDIHVVYEYMGDVHMRIFGVPLLTHEAQLGIQRVGDVRGQHKKMAFTHKIVAQTKQSLLSRGLYIDIPVLLHSLSANKHAEDKAIARVIEILLGVGYSYVDIQKGITPLIAIRTFFIKAKAAGVILSDLELVHFNPPKKEAIQNAKNPFFHSFIRNSLQDETVETTLYIGGKEVPSNVMRDILQVVEFKAVYCNIAVLETLVAINFNFNGKLIPTILSRLSK